LDLALFFKSRPSPLLHDSYEHLTCVRDSHSSEVLFIESPPQKLPIRGRMQKNYRKHHIERLGRSARLAEEDFVAIYKPKRTTSWSH
jgi:hypothetical protein